MPVPGRVSAIRGMAAFLAAVVRGGFYPKLDAARARACRSMPGARASTLNFHPLHGRSWPEASKGQAEPAAVAESLPPDPRPAVSSSKEKSSTMRKREVVELLERVKGERALASTGRCAM